MNRRSLLKSLVLIPFVGYIKPKIKYPIVSYRNMRIPLEMKPNGTFLYGIPYHQTNGTTGTWLGFSREGY